MKALILAGGRGKRLDDVSMAVNKCMVPVHGKHLIEFSLERAAATRVTEIVIVVGYRAEDIINTFGNRFGAQRIRYVIQYEQKGLVHAIECARPLLGGEDLLLLLGDECMLNPHHEQMVRAFEDPEIFAFCGVVRVADRALISKTYTILQGEDRRIFRLVEKPRRPLTDWMGTGNCLFRNEILSYIEQTPINPKRGEKELPDLIQCAIDDGKLVKSFEICDSYVNINSMEELRTADAQFFHF